MIVGREALRIAASIRTVAALVRAALRAQHAGARVNITAHGSQTDVERWLSAQAALAEAVSAYELAEPTAALAMTEEEPA